MTRFKAAAVGALAITLAAAPVASAFADGYGSHHHGHHHHYGNPFYPVVGLAAAVVGTAAAIVTLPFAASGPLPRGRPTITRRRRRTTTRRRITTRRRTTTRRKITTRRKAAPHRGMPHRALTTRPRAVVRASSPGVVFVCTRAPRVGQYGDFDGYRAPPRGTRRTADTIRRTAVERRLLCSAQTYGAPNADYALAQSALNR